MHARHRELSLTTLCGVRTIASIRNLRGGFYGVGRLVAATVLAPPPVVRRGPP